MRIPINFTGGSYEHKSPPLSAQVTRNFWPQIQEVDNAKSKYVLESFAGQKLFGTATGKDRGMFEHLGVLYKVSGTKLYSVDSAGSHTELGGVSGTARCIFAPIGSNLVFTTGGTVYQWDGSSLSMITDPDLESPNSVAHLNSQILFDGDGGRFATSDVGDATSIDALNYAAAESDADDLKRVYVFKQVAYMMGDKTIEPWWNSGAGKPPFDRIEQGIMPVGLAAIHSVANDDDYMYFLGDDGIVYKLQNYSQTPISTIAINRDIAGYTTISDAIGFCMNLEGQEVYVLIFPMEEKTWVFPKVGYPFEWSSGTKGKRNVANSYAYAFRKHLVADYRNGNIYELDFDTYTENGEPIIRTRVCAPIHGGLMGAPGKKITLNRMEFYMEVGSGLITGQGSDPVIMVSFSDDGGKTFGTERQLKVGKLGQYTYRVSTDVCGSFYERVIKITTSDPMHYSIYDGSIDVEVGI